MTKKSHAGRPPVSPAYRRAQRTVALVRIGNTELAPKSKQPLPITRHDSQTAILFRDARGQLYSFQENWQYVGHAAQHYPRLVRLLAAATALLCTKSARQDVERFLISIGEGDAVDLIHQRGKYAVRKKGAAAP